MTLTAVRELWLRLSPPRASVVSHRVIYSLSNDAENYFIRASRVKCLFVEMHCHIEMELVWKSL